MHEVSPLKDVRTELTRRIIEKSNWENILINANVNENSRFIQ